MNSLIHNLQLYTLQQQQQQKTCYYNRISRALAQFTIANSLAISYFLMYFVCKCKQVLPLQDHYNVSFTLTNNGPTNYIYSMYLQ